MSGGSGHRKTQQVVVSASVCDWTAHPASSISHLGPADPVSSHQVTWLQQCDCSISVSPEDESIASTQALQSVLLAWLRLALGFKPSHLPFVEAMFRKHSTEPQAYPSVFPRFLQPSLAFRRKSRQSSTDSANSTLSTFSAASTASTQSSNPFSRCATPVPVPVQEQDIAEPTDKFLHGHKSHIQCTKCSTDLALTSQIISKGFTGRHGRAYLVQGSPSTGSPSSSTILPNTYLGKSVPRSLVTGQHMVSDVSCAICGSLLGWKYVEASEESQKYKVGKFILETKRIRIGVTWEEGGDASDQEWQATSLTMAELRKLIDQTPSAGENDELEFDSQDEDECEDLFAGVWSSALAKKRRQRKRERIGRRAQKKPVFIPSSSSRESLASRDSSRF